MNVANEVFGAAPSINLHGSGDAEPTTASRSAKADTSAQARLLRDAVAVRSYERRLKEEHDTGGKSPDVGDAASQDATPATRPANRPSTEAASAHAASVTAAFDAIQDKHLVFLRALTSRIAELKSTIRCWTACDSSSWSGKRVSPSEAAYLGTLRQVRDTCHEWAAVDVVRALNSCNGVIEVLPSPDDESVPSALVPLRGGIPSWSVSSYPRLPWARYLCPVWESLLYSVYEDYAMTALEGLRKGLDALEGCFEAGRGCTEADLSPPGEEGEGEEEGEGKDAHERHAQFQAAMDRHAAATCAVEAVRRTAPLLEALSAAGGNPGPSAKVAATRAKRLAELHHGVAHLAMAAAVLSGSGALPGPDRGLR